ncbi:MAG: formylglycine-generating enzyme family protein [Betaproteobacteria bacterium]|nr:formylglycine-generating enzyme family protein [Betaproteobacteria bacterium]MDE2211366.1 formylglycine-generating enzyme family protein [Betaproteobacteria bacterium]
MIGSTIHVIKLGAGRMEDMRKMASYDLKEESARVRAAGEDITLQEKHEAGRLANQGYTVVEADRLLSREQWEDLATMIVVPAGPFTMGTDLDRADVQDKPAHRVVLKAYSIDKYPVTNAQYARFVAATGHRPPLNWKNGRIPQGELLYPVTMVTWYDASAYAKWAHKRLPTEAEFEKAGRGSDGRRWPWGDKMEPDRLNTYYNVGSASKVGSFPRGASTYGVTDLAGNVDEWTADDFLPYAGSKAPHELFQGKVPVAGTAQDREMKISEQQVVNRSYKVLRGGSWKSDPFSTSLFHRDYSFANYASDFYGFRCASDVVKETQSP